MAENMQHWTARQRPDSMVLEGRFVRLERLDPDLHADGLFEASSGPDAKERFRWLPEQPPTDRSDFRRWVERSAQSVDPVYYAVIDRASGKVTGRQTIMRIDAANGVAEIGNIYWGPVVARTPAATEALFLVARHLFDDLGYRRFEWKCNNDNLPSRRAALRFGFRSEGLFRQHMVVKGQNRDTAWFAMTDKDWQIVKPAYLNWLSPDNFDSGGTQRRRLEQLYHYPPADDSMTPAGG